MSFWLRTLSFNLSIRNNDYVDWYHQFLMKERKVNYLEIHILMWEMINCFPGWWDTSPVGRRACLQSWVWYWFTEWRMHEKVHIYVNIWWSIRTTFKINICIIFAFAGKFLVTKYSFRNIWRKVIEIILASTSLNDKNNIGSLQLSPMH